MQAEDQGHDRLIEFELEGGVMRLAAQPVLLIDPAALWAFRRDLLTIVGPEAARALLTQFGFAHGWRTAGALNATPKSDGPQHSDDALSVLSQLGYFSMSAKGPGPLTKTGTTLLGSFEAKQQTLQGGQTEAPACWTTCGLISGYLSRTEGREVFALEDQCVGRGDAACHVLAKTREEWGDTHAKELAYYDRERLAALQASQVEAAPGAPERASGSAARVDETAGQDDGPEEPASNSPAMASVLDLTHRVATSEATVLITGESGVGKERIARLLHDWSKRAKGPFIAVNCGAMAEGLLDSELFGHARGAFTGAIRDRAGLFEEASGGTLLLDEIGDVSPGMQVKLLRVLQEHEIRRVGENRSRPVDVRLLGATNRNLAAAVNSGAFRSDLYYRLKVVELHVPPLRARRGDIMELARTLLDEAALRMKRKIDGFTPAATALLLSYDWPGNVRELENIMERAVALAMGDRIEVEDLPDDLLSLPLEPPLPSAPDTRPLRAIEKEYILASLELNHGNQTHTALQLEIGSATLYRKLKSYGALSGDRS